MVADDPPQASRPAQHEHLLLLEILEHAPIAVWAASGGEHDYAIRIWNSGAERLYGYSHDEAIGANYLDLFVNELERDQAIADHERTILQRKTYRNLARDVTADGSERLILTQGFPLWDPRTSEYLQAEIGTDVTEISGEDAEWLSNVRATATKAKLVEPFTSVAQWLTSLGHHGVGVVSGLIPLICDSVRTLTDQSARCRVWKDGPDKRPVLLDGSDEVDDPGEYEETALVDWVRGSRRRLVVDYASSHPPVQTGGRRRREQFPVRPAYPGRHVPFAALPLNFGTDLVGVLLVYLSPGTEIAPFLRKVLEQFAKHAALGISTAELIGHLKVQTEIIAESEARRMREDMVDDFTHRIRQVATPIKQNVWLLREQLSGVGVESTVAISLDTVESLADEMLSWLRESSTSLGQTTFDLDALLLGMWRTLRIEHQGLHVTYRNSLRGPVHVNAVRPFVANAIKNVTDNAVEAMEGQGTLDIALRRHPVRRGLVELRVRDSGPGMSEADLERAWTPDVPQSRWARATGCGEPARFSSSWAARPSSTRRAPRGRRSR